MKKANLDFSISFLEQALGLVRLICLVFSNRRFLMSLDFSRSCNAIIMPLIEVTAYSRYTSVPPNPIIWLVAVLFRRRQTILVVGMGWSYFLSHIVLGMDRDLVEVQQCQWNFSQIVFGVWKFGIYCWLVDAVVLLFCLIVGVLLFCH